MIDYIKKKHSSIIPAYCFKENWDDGRKLGLDHFWNCKETVPDINSWLKITDAEFFDIKLSSTRDSEEYYAVIDKIKEISKIKPVFLHFSNEASTTLSEHAILLFWELAERASGSGKLYLEFEHKCVGRDKFKPNTDFFEKIIKKYGDADWVKLSILDKDEISEYIYYHKNMDLVVRNT
jgi:hypothetical protein